MQDRPAAVAERAVMAPANSTGLVRARLDDPRMLLALANVLPASAAVSAAADSPS